MANSKKQISIFWFRRDLRLDDNAGLFHALQSPWPVLPLFIFDTEILEELEDKKDARVEFIHQCISDIHNKLISFGSGLRIETGNPPDVWKKLRDEFDIKSVFANHDYEPYALLRDESVRELLEEKKIPIHTFKDQVIFEKSEIVKDNGEPYTIFTPYSKKWKSKLDADAYKSFRTKNLFENFFKWKPTKFPQLSDLGFSISGIHFPSTTPEEEIIRHYDQNRNFPAIEGTTRIGLHLRFGTISVRSMVAKAVKLNEAWLNELIWREFFMMILWHFPHVVQGPFKVQYANINWRNDETEFQKWCEGKTGFPMVDAGMRELNTTGFMHNRVRMVVAGFLSKHLLIDWRWGEAYFASKLLDYELSANNGNWQWAAGTGCDAAPYFRIFNPSEQLKKFDPEFKYVRKFVPEFGTPAYPEPMVDHKMARERCLKAYKMALVALG